VSPHIHHTTLCGCVLIPKSRRDSDRVVLQLPLQSVPITTNVV
jgi:hypothetical protein